MTIYFYTGKKIYRKGNFIPEITQVRATKRNVKLYMERYQRAWIEV